MTTKLKQKIQIVTIAQNKVLLLQFAKLYNEGFQNITGSVEQNESWLRAAQRELQEEIGAIAPLIDLHHDFHFHDRWGADVQEKIFLCLFDEIPSIILSNEHQNFKWVPLEKVTPDDYVFASNYEALKKAMEYIKK